MRERLGGGGASAETNTMVKVRQKCVSELVSAIQMVKMRIDVSPLGNEGTNSRECGIRIYRIWLLTDIMEE